MQTVLVVDSDAVICLNIADAVTAAGYTVLESYSAADALAVLSTHPEVTVLLTAQDLRGTMSGTALAAEARRVRPDILTIFATAFAHFEVGKLPAGAIYLPKPFTEEQIVSAVQTALGGRPSS